MLQKVLTSSKS